MSETKKIITYCIRCDKRFMSDSNRTKYCPDCKKIAIKESYKKSVAKNAKNNGKSKNSTQEIMRILRNLELYNKEHGTCLTYGQYVKTCNV